MDWTLTKIRSEVRALTGLATTSDLSDSDLTDWINEYYQEYLHDDVEVRELRTFYTFNTVVGTNEYTRDSDYVGLRPKVYCEGDEIDLYRDPDKFYKNFPERAIWLPSRAYVVGDVVTQTDSTGYLYICTVAGTSSSSEPTWPTTIDDTVTDGSVTWKYYKDDTQKPSGMLVYGSKIYIEDCPDKIYRIKIQATKKPTALDSSTNNDLSDNIDNKYGLIICYGAAIMILQRKHDIAGAAELAPMYDDLLSSLNAREIRQTRGTRAVPKW